MILVYDVDVKKTTADEYSISWNARRSSPSDTPVSDCEFLIYYSQDPESGFNVIATIDGAVGPLFYVHHLKQMQKNVDHYYKIRARHKTNISDYVDTKAYSDMYEYDGVIDTIIYAEEILNDYHIGEPVYLLKRKIDEGRCPECWNQYQYTRMKTHCNTCRGTGFVEGFYRPIEVQVAFEANPRVSIPGQSGELQVTNMRARMSNFPIVSPRDLIVKKDDNARMTIVKVDNTKLPNLSLGRNCKSGNAYIVSQLLDLAELTNDDPKYGVIVVGNDIKGPGTLAIPHPSISNPTTIRTHMGSGRMSSHKPGVV